MIRVSLDCSHCSRNGCRVASAIPPKIELRDQSVATVALLQFRRNQTLRDERCHHVEVGQHVERRRMKRRRPGFRTEVGSALKHGHRNAMTN
jgi:hypothetical protein